MAQSAALDLLLAMTLCLAYQSDDDELKDADIVGDKRRYLRTCSRQVFR
jgi:hypothetical protein